MKCLVLHLSNRHTGGAQLAILKEDGTIETPTEGLGNAGDVLQHYRAKTIVNWGEVYDVAPTREVAIQAIDPEMFDPTPIGEEFSGATFLDALQLAQEAGVLPTFK